MTITHVLFDFDGTLVNSVDELILLLDVMIKEVNPNLGLTPWIREYTPNLTSVAALCKVVNDELDLNFKPDEFTRTVLTRLPDRPIVLLPGVERLVKHLHAHGIPCAVASGTIKPYYDRVIPRFGDFFTKYFTHAVCAFTDPGVVHKKPAPDTYIVAAERFPHPPADMSTVLIVEDSVTGLEGATAVPGGAKVMLVTKSTNGSLYQSAEGKEYLKKTDLVVDSLENFRPETLGLPPYTD